MYADRLGGREFNAGSLGVAIGINAVLVGALLFAAPDLLPAKPREPFTGVLIDTPPLPPPPPEPAPPVDQRRMPSRPTDTVLPPPPRPDVFNPPVGVDPGFTLPGGSVGSEGGVAGGTGAAPVDPPKPPPPVIVAPGIDTRYAGLLQPTYPAAERRAGREGRVVARVLVGTDGRVKAIEKVLAASDAFWQATEDQARRRWRFTPGTRDGVPVEAWRTMTLTFRLEE